MKTTTIEEKKSVKLTVEKRPIGIVGLASAIEKSFSGFVVLFTDIEKKDNNNMN